MLSGIDTESCLPTDEISYVAFRLAAKDTLARAAEQLDRDPGQRDDAVGFLNAVEMLQSLPTRAQLQLLGDVWARHRSAHARQATFLDAAVVYAACQTAAALIRDHPATAAQYLEGGPRRVFSPPSRRLAERVEEAFKDVFWQEVEMLRGERPWPQTTDEQAQAEADLRLPAGTFAPLLAVLAAAGDDEPEDPQLERLVGLLTAEEVCRAAALLEVEVPEHLLRP
jgi:hypothetical protein